MRIWIAWSAALAMSVALSAFASQTTSKASQQTPAAPAGTASAGSAAPKSGSAAAQAPEPPVSDEDRANQLSDQVGKLMVKCVNLLTAQDPLSLDYCKQQRDLADQYPGQLRIVDRMLAHDEYGIALAAFDHKPEALAEFDRRSAPAQSRQARHGGMEHRLLASGHDLLSVGRG